jgi:pimeloyl-ACP methyl ester carboxylesterase
MAAVRRGRILWSVAASVSVAALLAACTSGAEGADRSTGSSSTTSPPRPDPVLYPTDCIDPSTPLDSVSCSTLVVPEDRAHPDGRQVELPVVRVAASGAPQGAAPDQGPVVYLHGGPGAGAVRGWITWTMLADGLGRDVVAYDQRGGGDATPRLDCPEHDEAVLDVLGDAATWTVERANVADSLERCRARWLDDGVGLDRYDTPTSVQDLEDLRIALGAETMTLIGVSYGSRLALDYQRTHPDRVSSLVLDGIDAPGAAGPEVERTLLPAAVDRLVAACAADQVCAAAHPDLGERIERVVRTYDAAPLAATLPASPDGERTERALLLTGADLLAGLFSAMYDGAQIPLLPSIVEQLDAGDTAVVELVLRRAAPALLGGATAAAASVDCADLGVDGDELAAESRTDPGDASTMVLTGTGSFCDVWQADPVDASFLEAVDPEAMPPTLVVAGELDPITPAEGARALADTTGATYLEVPRGGHVPLLTDACARRVLRSFLIDPAAPDVTCTATMAPMPFT